MALRTARRTGASGTLTVTSLVSGSRAPRPTAVVGGPGLGAIPSMESSSFGGDLGTQLGGAIGGDTGAILGGAIGNYLEGRFAGGGSEPSGTPSIPGQLVEPAGCPGGTIPFRGKCVDPSAALPGGDPFVFEAPSGNGAGFLGNGSSPMVDTRQYRECGRGAVLARDGLCYDKRVVRNSDRMWPRGRRPLLTGGDMNAITKAARAARRVRGTQKKLQKLGLLPKPSRGGRHGASPGRITKSEAARALRS